MTEDMMIKRIYDLRKRVKKDKDEWHAGYYDGLSAALLELSENKPTDTGEPIWVTSKMTLTELACELRKILWFRWLALDYTGYISLWNSRPKYAANWQGSNKTWQRGKGMLSGMSGYIFPNAVGVALNLEEYTDESGEIDYSRCIVEVE